MADFYTPWSDSDALGSVILPHRLHSYMQVNCDITLDFKTMPKTLIRQMTNALKYGYVASKRSECAHILWLLAQDPGVPQVPRVGYVGKKNLELFVPNSRKPQEYKTDLIAAGIMVDVDFADAVVVYEASKVGVPGLHKIEVRGYQMHVKRKSNAPRWRASYDGTHLQARTSKLADMYRAWGKEVQPMRQPLIDFISALPTITHTLTKRGG
jgi:hypothetical protein